MQCTTRLRSWGELNRYKPPPMREAEGQELIILSLELWSPFFSFASWFLSCSQRNIQTLYITASCRTREEQWCSVSTLEGPRCTIWFGRHEGNLSWPSPRSWMCGSCSQQASEHHEAQACFTRGAPKLILIIQHVKDRKSTFNWCSVHDLSVSQSKELLLEASAERGAYRVPEWWCASPGEGRPKGGQSLSPGT